MGHLGYFNITAIISSEAEERVKKEKLTELKTVPKSNQALIRDTPQPSYRRRSNDPAPADELVAVIKDSRLPRSDA
jgi:hypothetical protein